MSRAAQTAAVNRFGSARRSYANAAAAMAEGHVSAAATSALEVAAVAEDDRKLLEALRPVGAEAVAVRAETAHAEARGTGKAAR